MRRRVAALALVALVAACGGGDGGAAKPRPSVLLVSIDTLRADHLGLYGYPRATSPFLDRLGAQGIVFEQAFTSAAWTLVAHMTMLTGLYPAQHGVVEGDEAVAPSVPLLAERLSHAGYQTLGFFRPGWVHERHGFGRGFDVWSPHQSVEEAEGHLFDALAKLSPERPSFVFLHLFDVHNDPSTKSPPTIFSTPPEYQELFLPDAAARLEGETYLSIKKKKLSDEQREALIALYDQGVRHVDASLERIFARLEREGRLANTLVIVTADHGESLAQRDNYGHGGPWQEGLRIPLIVNLPGHARAGERVHEVAHLVDVATTVLDYVGLPADPALPGRSLLAPLPAARVIGGGHDPVEYAVRWPEKVVRFGNKFGRFDLAQDPGELSGDTATREQFDALVHALELAPGSIHAPVPIGPLPAEDQAALEALGYGGGEEKE